VFDKYIVNDNWWRKRLSDYREEVRGIDLTILELINKRMEICLEIGEIKENLGKPVFDSEQEKRVIEDRVNVGAILGLEEVLVRGLMNLIMDYSKKLQTQIRDNTKGIEPLHFKKAEEIVT